MRELSGQVDLLNLDCSYLCLQARASAWLFSCTNPLHTISRGSKKVDIPEDLVNGH